MWQNWMYIYCRAVLLVNYWHFSLFTGYTHMTKKWCSGARIRLGYVPFTLNAAINACNRKSSCGCIGTYASSYYLGQSTATKFRDDGEVWVMNWNSITYNCFRKYNWDILYGTITLLPIFFFLQVKQWEIGYCNWNDSLPIMIYRWIRMKRFEIFYHWYLPIFLLTPSL